MHDFTNKHQPSTQLAAGMEIAKIGWGEIALLKGDGQRITQRHLHKSGCGRRQPIGAGFGGLGQGQANAAGARQRLSGLEVMAISAMSKREA